MGNESIDMGTNSNPVIVIRVHSNR